MCFAVSFIGSVFLINEQFKKRSHRFSITYKIMKHIKIVVVLCLIHTFKHTKTVIVVCLIHSFQHITWVNCLYIYRESLSTEEYLANILTEWIVGCMRALWCVYGHTQADKHTKQHSRISHVQGRILSKIGIKYSD